MKVDNVTIPEQYLSEAAKAIVAQLGEGGIQKVGGSSWWQWRRRNSKFEAEWIEMRGDYNERKRLQDKGRRVMLYVHGGAYFFGSVDEHRYQMQRHARKLRARVFAPRYRLSPQFPFPCGLQDCLAAYLYLLTVQDPTEIILAGDSAGGGMIVSLLVTLRDRELPLPAGAILISPWVDLTHSFPSVAGGNEQDYIPSHGFMQRPSASWPPPNDDELERIRNSAGQLSKSVQAQQKSDEDNDKSIDHTATQAFAVYDASKAGDPAFDSKSQLSILLDGSLVVLKDQIQMYATNTLLAHPLVSPVLQSSLGGLPPLLILTGGGEVLRDEQIYLAHKAANPTKYPPSDFHLAESDPERIILDKYKPTYVQLQVWDDLCHVAPTLSFTRPAKFMYRSIAQFGAWALARAQKTAIEILDDDDISIISSGSESSTSEDESTLQKSMLLESPTSQIGRAGDPLPPFQSYMIRQRVDRHGGIYPLAPASQLPGCQLPPEEIGAIKPGPVRKWIAAKKEWDTRYRRQKRRVQKRRIQEMLEGYETFGDGERPPPSALAGRRLKRGAEEGKTEKKHKSYGMMLWSLWGSSHDKKTMEREDEIERRGSEHATGDEAPKRRRETVSEGRQTRDGGVVVDTTTTTVPAPASAPTSAKTLSPGFKPSRSHSRRRDESFASRSRSRRRAVTDTGQTESEAYNAANKARGSVSTGDTNPMITFATESPTQLKAPPQPFNKHLFIRSSAASSFGGGGGSGVDTASILSSRTNASTAAVIGAPGVLRSHERPRGNSDGTQNQLEKTATNDATGEGGGDTSSVLTRPETPPSRGSLVRLKSHQFDAGDGDGEGGGLLMSPGVEKLRSPSTVAVMGSEGVVGKVGPSSSARMDDQSKTREDYSKDIGNQEEIPGYHGLRGITATDRADKSNTGTRDVKQMADPDRTPTRSRPASNANDDDRQDPSHLNLHDSHAAKDPPETGDSAVALTPPSVSEEKEGKAMTANINVNANAKRPGLYDRADTEFMTATEGP